jgi:hypothetical protein
MNKLIVALFLLTIFSSFRGVKKAMNSWIGSSKTELILKWGPPDRTTSDGGEGEILIYAKQVYISSDYIFWDYKMFYIDVTGKIYHWRAERKRVPPAQIDLNIYKRY